MHLIDESPIVFSARKAYFRVGAGSPCADRFHVRSLRRIRLLIRKSDKLSANNAVCLFTSIPHKKDALPGTCAEKLILILTHPPCAFTRRAPSLIISQSEIVYEGYKASDKRETGSETARFSDDKAYTLRPSGASVMAKTQPSFWSITAFSGRHGVTLWRPLPLRSLREPQFYPQKSGAFSANSVKQLFPFLA